jgi:hypothetical protein
MTDGVPYTTVGEFTLLKLGKALVTETPVEVESPPPKASLAVTVMVKTPVELYA